DRLGEKLNFQTLRIPGDQSMGERDKCTLCHNLACTGLERARITNYQLKDGLGFEVLRAKMSTWLSVHMACAKADCYRQQTQPISNTQIHSILPPCGAFASPLLFSF